MNKAINPRPTLHLKTEPPTPVSAKTPEPPTTPKIQDAPITPKEQPQQDAVQHRWVMRAITQDRLVRFMFLSGETLDGVIVNSGRFSIELASGELLFKHGLRAMKFVDAPAAM